MDNVRQARKLNISLSHNKMEAYISIEYCADDKGVLPPRFNVDELKAELNKVSITYGIDHEALQACIHKEKVKNILVASGDNPVDEEDDRLELRFNIDSDIKKLNEDSNGRVNFKSIGSIDAILKGSIIAVRYPGKEGIAGKDVTGKDVKPKAGKRIKLRAGQGTELRDENTVAASIDGKPCIKNTIFYVYTNHEVRNDVDIKTGNIVFLGDITVKGSVKEGMEVHSGNSITVFNNLERAQVTAKGEVDIKGNVISSRVVGGGEDSEKLKQIESLSLLEKSLEQLTGAVEEVKRYNMFGYDTSDGQIIKLLLESKFKLLPKMCLTVLAQAIKNNDKEDLEIEKIITFIKTKLIGLSPLNIKHYGEVLEILEVINNGINNIKQNLSLPVNVKLSYCQDSVVESSGDIIFTGLGSYVSSINAHGRIHFINEHSVVRGGTIKAGKEIKCSTVGSHGRVATKLITAEKGHIWINTAYENTIIVIGSREAVIDYPCKAVHAYLDKDYELIIDRLKL